MRRMSDARVGERTPDALQAGRAAFKERMWPEAFDRLSQADREGSLAGPDLELLREAAFFAARADVRLDITERAYAAYLAAGDRVRAAFLALELADAHVMRGNGSLASGWTRRAERLLADEPEFLHRSHGAGFGAADALAGGIACERPVGITLPHCSRFIHRPRALVVCLLIAYSRQHVQAVAKKSRLRLYIKTGHGFTYPL